MENILIVCKKQFGYHTDITKWCEYLKETYNVSVITLLGPGKKRFNMEGIHDYSILGIGPRSVRGTLFMLHCLVRILFFRGPIIICYFNECKYFKMLLPWKKMILDIRTMDVSWDDEKRKREDALIRKTTSIYNYVTAISRGVAERLNVDEKKVAILPLGADIASTERKGYDSINLLYVGTFTGRKIENTIRGFSKALDTLPSNARIHYYMVGDGFNGELEESRKLVSKLKISDRISLPGYIQHEELKDYFNKCNVGISYVPIKDFYEHQPVTKTFEYALSGLYVLATSTSSNKEVINDKNGLLIDDSIESFAKGIVEIYYKRDEINDDAIRNSMIDYQWKNIVNKQMIPIIKRFYKK